MDKNKNSGTERAIRLELRNKRKECPKPSLEEAKKGVKEANGTKRRQKQAVSLTSTSAADSDGVRVTGGSGFLEPQSRLGHLKKIHFRRNSIKDLEAFENVCELTHRGDTSLKLKEISFISYGSMYYDGLPTPPFFESPDMQVRSENAINRLLECSQNSLETIGWDPSTGLLGLKWPEILPNVQQLTISIALGDRVSPNGFSWSTTFPKLRSVSLGDVIGEQDFTNAIDLLFQQQKVGSVKDIHVHAEDGWSKKDRLIAAQLKRLRSIFPNAEIDICVPLELVLIGGSAYQKRCQC